MRRPPSNFSAPTRELVCGDIQDKAAQLALALAFPVLLVLSRITHVALGIAVVAGCQEHNQQRHGKPAAVASATSAVPTRTATQSDATTAREQSDLPARGKRSDRLGARPKQGSEIEIVSLGPYVPYDDAAQDERNPAWWRSRLDDKWLALCQGHSAVQLVPTRMQVTPAVIDGNKNELIVSASQCPDAIVLVRGLSGPGGVIPTARVTHKAVPSPREQDTVWLIFLLGQTWRLHFEDANGLPLMVSIGAQTQELRNWKDAAAQLADPGSARHDWGFAGSVKILWAGDLNVDEQMDLLLKQGDAEIGVSVELYLSSGGSAAPHLVLADRFNYGGC